MPTINTTPVQVPSNGRYNQYQNQDNPFYVKVGTSLYQVLFSAQGPSVPRAVGIFKRTANAVGTAWTEKDAANSPDQGNQAGIGCVSVNGTVITIAYILFASTALRLCSFDTSTDTWGTPGDTTTLPDFLATPSFHFCFVQRSDDTFVVVAAAQFYTYYLTNIAGVWGTATSVLPIGGVVCCGVIDSTDTIHIAISTTLGQIDYRQLSSGYVLGGATTISEMNLFSESRGRLLRARAVPCTSRRRIGWPALLLLREHQLLNRDQPDHAGGLGWVGLVGVDLLHASHASAD